jgi:membrane protein involved in colicin uptake
MTTTTHSTELTRSTTMNEMLVRALSRERIRQQDDRQRAEYVRRLVVLRRRQRRADAARRALAAWSVR